MDMRIDSRKIRAERETRAWSQEHLATVSGLGLRTIQRIEKTGAASFESARALAAVFEVSVADLRVVRDDAELSEKAAYILHNPWTRWPELEEYLWVGVRE